MGHFHEHLYDAHEQGLAAQQVFFVHDFENGGGIENRDDVDNGNVHLNVT